MPRVDINHEVLAWAMQTDGVSSQALAAATGRPTETVEKWVRGKAQPYKGDLEKMARLFGRSPQFFFLPGPPRRADSPVNRRAALVDTSDATTQELTAVRAVARLQSISRWSLDRGDAVPLIFPSLKGANPETYAVRMRLWLEWDVTEQVRATSKSRVFRMLRERVEARGIIVVLRDIGTENSRGFSIPDALAPIVFINAGFNLASVRSYTLLHELGHLARDDGALHHEQDTDAERWCESFAAAFLLPGEHLTLYLSKGVVSRTASDDIRRVALVSNRYKASWESVARRLHELRLAPYSLVQKVVDAEPRDKGFNPAGEGRPTSARRLDEFGTNFPRLLLSAVQEDALTPLDVRKYLRVDASQLSEMANLLAVGA